MGAGGTGGLGFLFRFFYNSIKEGFASIKESSRKGFEEIKIDLVNQKVDITNLSDKFNSFNLIIQKIDITLTSVEKDLEKANENLSETRKLALDNESNIKDNAHRIGNVEGNLLMIKELVTKLDELEKDVIVLQSKNK